MKGHGGVPIPDLRRASPDDTPPAERLRDTLRREEAARITLDARVTHAEGQAQAAEVTSKCTAAKVEGLDWKINLILAGVGASFGTLVVLAAWTVISLQKATSETRTIAGQEARAVAIVVIRDEVRALFEQGKR